MTDQRYECAGDSPNGRHYLREAVDPDGERVLMCRYNGCGHVRSVKEPDHDAASRWPEQGQQAAPPRRKRRKKEEGA
jgi:hypothetical protein